MSRTIHIDLSVASINRAIAQLEQFQESIESRTEKMLKNLVEIGESEAKAGFRGTAAVSSNIEGTHAAISASGEAVIIMEFGAGMATMEGHPLRGNAPVPVYRWSYSELVGSGEGYMSALMNDGLGIWHFAGRPYSAIEPRHGMLDARDWIWNNAEYEARRAFME